jgi:Cys-tRNA(Pro)/Cys-tRNA(Cys) deacylase
MTPAIRILEKARVAHRVHEYAHDPSAACYGEEAAAKLGVDQGRVFKTLIVALAGGAFAVAIVPVSGRLSLKRIARTAGAKKAVMADPADVERVSGYVLGAVSPLAQKRRLPTFIDTSSRGLDTIYVSAGRRGLQIELAPGDLDALTGATFAELCQEASGRGGTAGPRKGS